MTAIEIHELFASETPSHTIPRNTQDQTTSDQTLKKDKTKSDNTRPTMRQKLTEQDQAETIDDSGQDAPR